MTVIATSAGVVALAEMGDKTQLLAILLAVRFRAPFTVLAGIVVATLANHALAAWAGIALAQWLSGPWFAVAVSVGFLAMAAWTLVPDKLDEGEMKVPRGGALVATVIAFFVVEIGDKTQVATMALAARYQSLWAVTAGTTLGMVLANAPAVWLGEALLKRVPMALVRRLAAALFAVLGIAGLWVALT
ncbi:TMEM165/GDT1 family protein [Polymorphobacter sp.]|uniref:TMEM165/GDT1 family protein n=1 Tax=Polymorphobacter sp. TaxID=1909290 RepID=UPI003F71811D